MAQDDKVKLQLLVEMVKALDEFVQYLSYFTPNSKDILKSQLLKKIKDAKDKIE